MKYRIKKGLACYRLQTKEWFWPWWDDMSQHVTLESAQYFLDWDKECRIDLGKILVKDP